MEYTKLNQSNTSRTKSNENKKNIETENKANTDPGYLDNREEVDDVKNSPEETDANPSLCIFCKTKISSLKGECHSMKTYCVYSQKEHHEDSKNSCTSENMHNQKCTNVSSKICGECLCVDCWKDPEISCSKCQCCCEEEDEFELDPVIPKEGKDRELSGGSEEDITKKEAKEAHQLEKIYERVLEEMKEKEANDEQNNTTKTTVPLNVMPADAEESIEPAAENKDECILQNPREEYSSEMQVTNLHEETWFRRLINFLYSFIYGNEGESLCTRIMNYFYGFFQQITADTNMNPSTGL